MNKKFLSLALAILAPFAYSETRETNGIFDCYFMEEGESKTLSGWDTAITSSTSWTTEQKGAVHRSLDTWMGLINNSAGRQLTALFSWADDLGEDVLGGSSSGYDLPPFDSSSSFAYSFSPVEFVWRNGGNHDAQGNFDIVIQFSSLDINQFYFGEEATVAWNEIDFQSVMTHEFGHNMGFDSTSFEMPGTTGGWKSDKEGKPGLTTFDSLMTQKGQSLAENLEFGLGSTIDVGSDGLTVYNPSPWESGSSMAHIDPDSDPYGLMNPSIDEGVIKRAPSVKELLLMQEMGWSINWTAAGVPEPSSSVLFLLAGGVFLLRRNRKREQA